MTTMTTIPDKTDRQALEALLHSRGSIIRGNAATCPDPNHLDRHPSASIYSDATGHWRVKCHTCNRSWDALDLLSEDNHMTPAQMLRQAKANADAEFIRQVKANDEARLRMPTKVWPDVKAVNAAFPKAEMFHPYTDPSTGRVDLIVIRRPNGSDGPKISQVCYDAQAKGYVPGGVDNPQPLYNRKRVAEAECVVVVEGERDVEALHQFGIVATTAPMGSGCAGKADWSPLAGKHVVLWSDRDEAGKSHMDEVQKILSRIDPAIRLRRLDPEALDLRKDADEHICWLKKSQGRSDLEIQEDIRQILAAAPAVGPLAGLNQRVEDLRDGRRTIESWPSFPTLSKYIPLTGGSVVALVGPEGSGKSLFLGQCLAQWHSAGIRVSALMLEKDMEFYQNRLVARLEGDVRFADERWQKENPERVKAAYRKHETDLIALERNIHTCQVEWNSDSIVRWTSDQANAGMRLLVIDPLSAMSEKLKIMAEDHKSLVRRIEIIARQSELTVILSTHPRNGFADKPEIDAVYGGKGVTRFTDYVFWIHNWPDDHAGSIHVSTCAQKRITFNRGIILLKTRSSGGAGRSLAFTLDPVALKFIEHGVIVPKPK